MRTYLEVISELKLLLFSNIILGAMMPMLIVLGGLSGYALAPTAALSTLPPSVQMLAGLLATMPMSALMGKYGRKVGFAVGATFALAGALLGMIAFLQASFLLLCLAHMFFGVALISFAFFRFAAGEQVAEMHRPTAVSIMIASGLVAAFVGPGLFNLSRDFLAPIPLAGAYAMAGVLAFIGGFFRFVDQRQGPSPEPKGPLVSPQGTAVRIAQRRYETGDIQRDDRASGHGVCHDPDTAGHIAVRL